MNGVFKLILTIAACACLMVAPAAGAEALAPMINGPKVYGQRPGRPFLYTIPATGERPMTFAAEELLEGLKLDAKTGRITGTAPKAGEYAVTLRATNAKGSAQKPFKIVIGDKIALTPPMGWNSWNCWAGAVDQDKVLRSARAMASSGLINHGWTYVNIDDTWQGKRDPQTHALQGNEKFPDMKKLCDEVHALGLKAGIYSTPWIASYARYPGGSADNPAGDFVKPTQDKKGVVNKKIKPWHMGDIRFTQADAKQWADWGFDYLKYDWNPIEEPEVKEIHNALLESGRDVVLSLSNNLPFEQAEMAARWANAWRTTGDIRDNWYSLSGIGFSQSKWAPYAAPGHWNDPDMLVVGHVGWGPKLHPTSLTPDEQYTHVSLWCLLSAPLLIGCDLERLDPFTISLLTNDEVLAIDQDSLGRPATLVSRDGGTVQIKRTDGREGNARELPRAQVWAKELDDGSRAVGLFNLGDEERTVTARFADLKISGSHVVRDLWQHKDVATAQDQFGAPVPPHGVVLVKLTPAVAQAGVPRADGKKKLVIIAGKPSHPPRMHEFRAGSLLLQKCLANVPGLTVEVGEMGWVKDDKSLDDADAIVIYADGGEKHPAMQPGHLAMIEALAKRGVGLGMLHYGVTVPVETGGHAYKRLMGGHYEEDFSCNPLWEPAFEPLPQHPITRGVKPFTVNDEWYFNLRFADAFAPGNKPATAADGTKFLPILVAKPTDATRNGPYVHPKGPYPHIIADRGRAETMMWAVERPDGGRSFGFTGGHFHDNWGNDDFRKTVLNAMLWIAKVDVPAGGVESTVTKEQLEQNLDPKPPPKKPQK